jgi:mRNA interferase HigB
MHVIAKPALVAFWTLHPDAERPLTAWHTLMRLNDFGSFAELKATFGSVDHVDGFTVFDIGGNKFRLIVAIHYNRGKVYIRDVLTHSEYDRGTWKRRKS